MLHVSKMSLVDILRTKKTIFTSLISVNVAFLLYYSNFLFYFLCCHQIKNLYVCMVTLVILHAMWIFVSLISFPFFIALFIFSTSRMQFFKENYFLIKSSFCNIFVHILHHFHYIMLFLLNLYLNLAKIFFTKSKYELYIFSSLYSYFYISIKNSIFTYFNSNKS